MVGRERERSVPGARLQIFENSAHLTMQDERPQSHPFGRLLVCPTLPHAEYQAA